MIAIPLAKKIAELFLILFTTAALVKGGILKSENSKVLSKLSLYFVTPCVIFNSFQKELTPEIEQGLLTAAALAVGFQILFFLIAMLYLCIIIVPKRPKKGIKRIITQDTSDLEKEYFAEYLNYERERRKELREAAKTAAAEAAEAEEAAEAAEKAKEAAEESEAYKEDEETEAEANKNNTENKEE